MNKVSQYFCIFCNFTNSDFVHAFNHYKIHMYVKDNCEQCDHNKESIRVPNSTQLYQVCDHSENRLNAAEVQHKIGIIEAWINRFLVYQNELFGKTYCSLLLGNEVCVECVVCRYFVENYKKNDGDMNLIQYINDDNAEHCYNHLQYSHNSPKIRLLDQFIEDCRDAFVIVEHAKSLSKEEASDGCSLIVDECLYTSDTEDGTSQILQQTSEPPPAMPFPAMISQPKTTLKKISWKKLKPEKITEKSIWAEIKNEESFVKKFVDDDFTNSLAQHLSSYPKTRVHKEVSNTCLPASDSEDSISQILPQTSEPIVSSVEKTTNIINGKSAKMTDSEFERLVSDIEFEMLVSSIDINSLDKFNDEFAKSITIEAIDSSSLMNGECLPTSEFDDSTTQILPQTPEPTVSSVVGSPVTDTTDGQSAQTTDSEAQTTDISVMSYLYRKLYGNMSVKRMVVVCCLDTLFVFFAALLLYGLIQENRSYYKNFEKALQTFQYDISKITDKLDTSISRQKITESKVNLFNLRLAVKMNESTTTNTTNTIENVVSCKIVNGFVAILTEMANTNRSTAENTVIVMDYSTFETLIMAFVIIITILVFVYTVMFSIKESRIGRLKTKISEFERLVTRKLNRFDLLMEKTNLELMKTKVDLQLAMTEIEYSNVLLKKSSDETKAELMATNTKLNNIMPDIARHKKSIQNQVTDSTNTTRNDIKAIKSELTAVCIPPGTVAYFADNTAPIGWLKAGGQSVSRKVYAKLFATIGTKFGCGDGFSTFSLPDLRGEFIRGWSDGRDVDETRKFGSFQCGSNVVSASRESDTFNNEIREQLAIDGETFDDGFQPYEEWKTVKRNEIILPKAEAQSITEDNTMEAIEWNVFNGTRPRNVALLACIKF